MSLSTELISQFVKVNNDAPTSKSEDVTLYGTIVSYADTLYVKMDGSTELTPMVNTATVKAGERVSVIVKNHTAIVTGNLSDPSASSDELHGITTSTDEIKLAIESMSLTINAYGITFKGLSDGTTVIDGGCIKTGTIDAKRINLKGSISFEDLSEDLLDKVNEEVVIPDVPELPSYIKSTYIDATTIKSPTIEGNNISVYGSFRTYSGNSITGYMGTATGADYYGNTTFGVAMSNSPINGTTPGLNYVIVTNGGCRVQAGSNRITVTSSSISIITSESGGKAYYNDTELGTAVFG